MSALARSGHEPIRKHDAMGQRETNGGAAKIRLIVLIEDTDQLGFDGVRWDWRILRDLRRERLSRNRHCVQKQGCKD
jgi:hypothetical protein